MKSSLTRRQLEIVALIANGYRVKEIASKLSIRFATALVHRKQIIDRLKLELDLPCVGTAEITHFAIARNLVPLRFTREVNNYEI
jgi:DNA-binding NarL/FixJ family response regulator